MEFLLFAFGFLAFGFLAFNKRHKEGEGPGSGEQMLSHIKSRRTCRRFDPKAEVTTESLRRILEAGTWAPYAPYEVQPWRFIAVRGEERERVVGYISKTKTIKKYMEAMLAEEPLPEGDDETKRKVWAEWNKFVEGFVRNLGQAPVTIVGLARQSRFKTVERYHIESAWTAAQNQMLQAHAEGLSSGIVTFHEPKIEKELIAYLGYTAEDWTVVYLLNVGHAKKIRKAADRLEGLYEIRG